MKWKAAAGLLLALAGWSRFSEDLPPGTPLFKNGNGLIGPPYEPGVPDDDVPIDPGLKPQACPTGHVWNGRSCVPKHHDRRRLTG